MKVLLINGSPDREGCTYTALCEVDADKCIGCKKCLKVGCPAVMMENKKSRIDPTQCVGCTVCAQVCPKDAITRKER